MHPFLQGLLAGLTPIQQSPHRMLLAVSGGADSTALAAGIVELEGRLGLLRNQLTVAHFDHRLRANSEEDANLVAGFCNDLAIDFHVGKASDSELADRKSDGIEAWARSARYRFLNETAGMVGARYILTGHTLNDQAETVLFRLLRGTGWRGAAGILPVHALSADISLLRPLLGVTRESVLDYLKLNQQTFVADPTNDSEPYTRNRIRHEVIPLMNDVMSRQSAPQLARFAGQMQRWLPWLETETARWAETCTTVDSPNTLRIDPRLFGQVPEVFRSEVVRHCWIRLQWPQQKMTEAHWQQCVEWALTMPTGEKGSLPGEIQAKIKDSQLLLTRRVHA